MRVLVQSALMIMVLVASVAGMSFLVNTASHNPDPVVRQTIHPVTVQTVQLTTLRPSIHLFGQVVAARTVDLRALVSGQIIGINENARIGARVNKGAVLVEIDPFTYEGALAEARANQEQTHAMIAEIEARIAAERDQMQSARDQLDLAMKDSQRAATLLNSGSITARQIEDRTLLVSQREQALRQRENNLAIEHARLEQQRAVAARLDWKIRQAERDVHDTRLVAPFPGIVMSANAEIGKSVNTNDAVLSLYSDDDLEARFTLTDAQFGRILTDAESLIGRPITASWSVGGVAYDYGGEVVRVAAEIAPDRGGVEIFARLERGVGPIPVRPGAFLDIVIADRAYESATRLPETALYDGDLVYLVRDGVLHSRSVGVAGFDGDYVIISGGLVDGDRVLTTRLSEASDGLLVADHGSYTGSPVVADKELFN